MLKENKIRFLIILGITAILCQGFLQMHFSSDTYVLADLGYMEYPKQYFLLDGRLISALVCFIGGILNLPLEVYIVGMNIIAVIFLASSIYVMSNILIKFLNVKSLFNEIIVSILAFILIFNPFTLEYLLFPESAVMCLGLFLIILAIKNWLDEGKYIKTFILLLIATICYQGLLNIFTTLVIFFSLLKIITSKVNKNFIKDILKLTFITALVLVIVIVIIEVGKDLLGSTLDRSNDLSSDLDITLKLIYLYIIELWNKSLNLFPMFSNYIIIIGTTVILALLKEKKTILYYLLFIFLILIMCVVPMFIFNTGPVARVNFPIAMILGTSLIILYIKCNKKFITYLIVGCFLLNGFYIVRNIEEHNKSNAIEENMGMTIKYAIEQYEKQTGITLTKFGYIYDLVPSQYAYGIKEMGSLTEKKFGTPWSIFEVMNYYTGRKFERVYTNQSVNIDYESFSYEQILFDGDTVYLIVY